jgi:flagellar M-ring protein FliF
VDPILQPLQRVLRGLSRTQQIGLGTIAVAGIGLAFIIGTFGRTPDMVAAFSGLSEEDEALVVSKLKDAKIPYQLADGGIVRVPGAQTGEARLALAGQGLGGKPASGSGMELFNQIPFGQTEFTQRVNYQRALESELARSISRMEAIDSARVHLVIPQPTLLTSQQKDPTASIIVKLKPGKRLDRAQARSMTNLVAGSVEGLKPQNLTIVDVNGNTLSDDTSDAGTGLTSKQLEMQHAYEANVEHDLQGLLDRVLGPGKAAVRVSAVMDWDQIEQTKESYLPTGPNQSPTVRASHEMTEKSSQPGTYDKSDKETTYELSKSVEKTIRASGVVTRLSVSVLLDDDPANPDQQLKQSVEEALTTAAGINTSRGDKLTVTTLVFNRKDIQTTEAAVAEGSQGEQYLTYAHMAALGLGLPLMLVVLFFLFRGRRTKSTTPVPAEPVRVAAAQPAAPPPAPRPVAQPIVEDPQRAYIRDQIQLLGKSNPSTVAQLIQTWMDEDRSN